MKKISIGIVLFILILISSYYVFFVYKFRGIKNGQILISKNLCEDYCPPETMAKNWYTVYRDIKDEAACKEVGGEILPSYAWGGKVFRACLPK